MTRLDLFGQFSPFTVGFDRVFDELNRVQSTSQSNYPPYNIRKGNEEDSYLIELAVAGFGKDDLSVMVKENNLTIEGDISHKDSAFVHQGISQRKFSRNFVLAEDVLVKGSDLSNGILSIFLERVVPEEKKARTIDIGKVSASMKKQFLAE
tara:strand:- start:4351 stop:4803 length:453 start_codon:yes stop_codon:yes gene_type:complete